MSEASMSVHFWRMGGDEIRQLATSQAVSSRIVASNGFWTCVVPFEAEGATQLAKVAAHIALVWSYYGDYALNLEFFDGGREAGAISLIWQPGMAPRAHAEMPVELLSYLVTQGVLTSTASAELEALARAVMNEEISGEDVRDAAAKIFRLAAYEWLSPDVCLDKPIEAFRQWYPEAEDIEAE